MADNSQFQNAGQGSNQNQNQGQGNGQFGDYPLGAPNPPPSQGMNPGAQNPFGPPPPPPQGGAYQDPFGPPPGGQDEKKEDTTPANFQLGSKLPAVINVKVPAHTLQFDEQKFLHLLAGSISLTKEEKARIIDSIPKLRQAQIDELQRIFEEERRKFAELPAKHVEQLKKLELQHYNDWVSLELDQKASAKKNEDQAKADEIRKQLGI
jgi:hypothetical protein